MQRGNPDLNGVPAGVSVLIMAGFLIFGLTLFGIHFYTTNNAMSAIDAHIADADNRAMLLNKTARYVHGQNSLMRESGLTQQDVADRIAASFNLHSDRFPSAIDSDPQPTWFKRIPAAAIVTAQITLSEQESPVGERVVDIEMPFTMLVNRDTRQILTIVARPELADITYIDPYLQTPHRTGAAALKGNDAHPFAAVNAQ